MRDRVELALQADLANFVEHDDRIPLGRRVEHTEVLEWPVRRHRLDLRRHRRDVHDAGHVVPDRALLGNDFRERRDRTWQPRDGPARHALRRRWDS